MNRTLLTAVVGGMVLAAGCSAAGTGPTDHAYALLGASPQGAIVLDVPAGTLLGIDRTGRTRWTDRDALNVGADATCAATCPDAVFSVVGDDPAADAAPWQVTDGRRIPVEVAATRTKRALAVQGPSDAVFVEGDTSTSLRIVRPGGEERIPVPSAAVTWSMNPQRTEAVAFAGPGTPLLRFGHDANGWHLTGNGDTAGKAWGACVAGEGAARVVTLVGDEPAVLSGDRRFPVRTDLRSAGECALGETSGAVWERSADQTGAHHTAVRGIDLEGRQTWSRDLTGEASVSASPDGRLFALASGGTLELVDANGTTTSARAGVAAAMFTAAGELVTVDLGGTVHWT